MHLKLFFVKLRGRMLIKKRNVSSNLKEIVNQTVCLLDSYSSSSGSEGIEWEEALSIIEVIRVVSKVLS